MVDSTLSEQTNGQGIQENVTSFQYFRGQGTNDLVNQRLVGRFNLVRCQPTKDIDFAELAEGRYLAW